MFRVLGIYNFGDCMHENKNITKPKAGAHSWGKFAFETLLCIKSKSIKGRIK